MLDSTVVDAFLQRALITPDPRWLASNAQGGEWSQRHFEDAQAAATRIQTETGGRIATAEGVKAASPYVKWTLRDLERPDSGGPRGRKVERLYVEAKVRRVQVFPSGQGSFAPLRGTAGDILTCVLGVPCTPVFLLSGECLGQITMSRFRSVHRRSYVDSETKFLVMELGAALEIVCESL